MTMNNLCDNRVAHDYSVFHQFCDSCDLETYSADEDNSVERADMHKAVMSGNHQMYLCEYGKQY